VVQEQDPEPTFPGGVSASGRISALRHLPAAFLHHAPHVAQPPHKALPEQAHQRACNGTDDGKHTDRNCVGTHP
jgi:hypothetical protein